MPLFGAHMSVSGGLTNAVREAVAHGCDTVQLFTKNASQWKGKPTTDADATDFKKQVKAAKLKHPTAHDSYLINLAAPDDELFQKSLAAFTDEIERAEMLGLSYLVTHPGAHTGSGEETGLKRVVSGLDEVHRRTAGFKVKVLLETTAGQGSTLGWRFEHLAFLLENTKDSNRLGVCLDTCHVFAAGYPLGTPAEYRATFDQFEDLIGVKRIKAFHVNDSVKPLGSRVDRHAGLGLGQIGEMAFRLLATDPRFSDRPMILETPKEDAAKQPMDPVNLGKLRAFALSPAA